MNWFIVFNISAVFFFGAVFGIAEILQRHSHSKDNYALTTWSTWLYVVMNGGISVLSFLVLINIGDNNEMFDRMEWKSIVIAGFAGMMVLRSSFFSYKMVSGEKIGVGLDAVIQIFLDWVEGNINNNAGSKRMGKIEKIMRDVDFDSAKETLSLSCTVFIDAFKKGDVDELVAEIDNLAKDVSIHSSFKSMQLGRLIAKYCGVSLLKKAVKKWKEENERECTTDGQTSAAEPNEWAYRDINL